MDALSILKMDALINCNRCGYMPCFDPTRLVRYFLTGCGKVFCESCARAKQNDQCDYCRGVCRFMEITGESNPEVKMFFMDPSIILKDALKKPMQIFQFQKTQQKHVCKIMTKLLESNKTVKQEMGTLKTEILQTKQACQSLAQLNQQLTQRINSYEGRNNPTPTFQIPTPSPAISTQSDHRSSLADIFGGATQPQGQNVNRIHETNNFQRSITPVTNQHIPQIRFASGGSYDGRGITPRSSSGYIQDPYRQTDGVSPAVSLSSGSFNGSQFMMSGPGSTRSVPPEKVARTFPRLAETPGTDSTKTPDIIQRLRHLRCSSSGTSSSSRF